MIDIANKLSAEEFQKAEGFIKRIKPLLNTREYQFKKSEKNSEFDRHFNLRNEKKEEILKSLNAKDCISIEPNDNPRYEGADVYKFIKEISLNVYGEDELHNLYIKMYLHENKNYDLVVVISFHKEGMYG